MLRKLLKGCGHFAKARNCNEHNAHYQQTDATEYQNRNQIGIRKRRFDLSLRCLRNEFVIFSQMHKQGPAKIVDLAQIFFSVSAVIGDGGIDVAAHGGQKNAIKAPRQ